LRNMVISERLVQRQVGSGDGANRPLLGLGAVADAGTERLLLLVLACGSSEDDAIADLPARDRLRQGALGIPLLGHCTQLEPRPAERRAVELHAPPTTDDGRA